MAFVPMLTEPSYTDPHWVHTSKGGLNPCILISGNSVLPNCVGFAFGRFMQILGKTPKLCRGDAGTWYGYTSDGYKRGNVPQLGAVLCWAKPGSWGHVAIVEKINPNGTFTVSQSSYQGKRFYTSTYSCSVPKMKGYVFQGFIYNPACAGLSDSLSEFLKEAQKHIGENGTWTWSTAGQSAGQPWATSFIIAVAKVIDGIVNVCIPNTFSASDIPRIGVKLNMGAWYPGPAQSKHPSPQPGDLVFFRWGGDYTGKDTYYSDHVGIVTSYKDGKITTVEGNVGGSSPSNSSVTAKQYLLSYGCINGYYRPDWSKVSSSANNILTGIGGNLYDMVNTKEDAIVREIGYMQGIKPSINSSNIKLSVINYTTALGAFFKDSIMNGNLSDANAGQSFNTDKLGSVPRVIAEHIASKGLPMSVGIGIAGNVQAECGFKIDTYGVDTNGLVSGGICQWNGENYHALANYCPTWRTNLTGQLDFLWYDMTSRNANWLKYQLKRKYGINDSFVNVLSRLPNTKDGAKRAADYFVRCYENPANVDKQSQKRQKFASDLWDKLTPQLKSM